MFCSLSSDAAKFLGIQMHDTGEADFGSRVICERFIQQDLSLRYLNDIDDHLGDGDAEPTVFGVDDDGDVVGDLIVLFVGDDNCVCDLFDQIVNFNAFFSFQQL